MDREGHIDERRNPALLFFLVLPALSGCEQHFSANPPALPAEAISPAPSSDATDPSLQPDAAAAPPAGAFSHTLIVMLCSSSPRACPASDASADAAYRVVFGSGRGVVRSRDQAMADLYQELRDRTASGERLDVELPAPDAGLAPAPSHATANPALRTNANSGDLGSDPITRCAFRLLDLVDGAGQITLDVVHWNGLSGCTVSVGLASAGTAQCLVKAPERPHLPGGKGGISF